MQINVTRALFGNILKCCGVSTRTAHTAHTFPFIHSFFPLFRFPSQTNIASIKRIFPRSRFHQQNIFFFLRFISIVSPFYLCVYAYEMRAYVEKKNILMERSQKQPYFHTCFNKIRCEKTPTVRIMNC